VKILSPYVERRSIKRREREGERERERKRCRKIAARGLLRAARRRWCHLAERCELPPQSKPNALHSALGESEREASETRAEGKGKVPTFTVQDCGGGGQFPAKRSRESYGCARATRRTASFRIDWEIRHDLDSLSDSTSLNDHLFLHNRWGTPPVLNPWGPQKWGQEPE
jgi:hypothetical protein